MDITEYSIIDENTVRLPKSICSYMRDNKEITLEILKMIEMLIQEKSTIKMNNELIIEIRNQNKTLTDYIKEMRTNFSPHNCFIVWFKKIGKPFLRFYTNPLVS